MVAIRIITDPAVSFIVLILKRNKVVKANMKAGEKRFEEGEKTKEKVEVRLIKCYNISILFVGVIHGNIKT